MTEMSKVTSIIQIKVVTEHAAQFYPDSSPKGMVSQDFGDIQAGAIPWDEYMSLANIEELTVISSEFTEDQNEESTQG